MSDNLVFFNLIDHASEPNATKVLELLESSDELHHINPKGYRLNDVEKFLEAGALLYIDKREFPDNQRIQHFCDLAEDRVRIVAKGFLRQQLEGFLLSFAKVYFTGDESASLINSMFHFIETGQDCVVCRPLKFDSRFVDSFIDAGAACIVCKTDEIPKEQVLGFIERGSDRVVIGSDYSEEELDAFVEAGAKVLSAKKEDQEQRPLFPEEPEPNPESGTIIVEGDADINVVVIVNVDKEEDEGQ